jgi:hypothetical protein
MLLYYVGNPVVTVHRFLGSATFLIGFVGGILVGRAARKAQGR